MRHSAILGWSAEYFESDYRNLAGILLHNSVLEKFVSKLPHCEPLCSTFGHKEGDAPRMRGQFFPRVRSIFSVFIAADNPIFRPCCCAKHFAVGGNGDDDGHCFFFLSPPRAVLSVVRLILKRSKTAMGHCKTGSAKL